MSHPTSSTSIQVNDATQPPSITASSSYDSTVPSTVEPVNHISKSPPSECLPLSIWSAQTTAANITLKLGSIKSPIKPTPAKAAVTIQRWHRHNHYTPSTCLLDLSLIKTAFQETIRSRPPVSPTHYRLRYNRYKQVHDYLYECGKTTIKQMTRQIARNIKFTTIRNGIIDSSIVGGYCI